MQRYVRVGKRSPGTSAVADSDSANATNTTLTCLEGSSLAHVALSTTCRREKPGNKAAWGGGLWAPDDPTLDPPLHIAIVCACKVSTYISSAVYMGIKHSWCTAKQETCWIKTLDCIVQRGRCCTCKLAIAYSMDQHHSGTTLSFSMPSIAEIIQLVHTDFAE